MNRREALTSIALGGAGVTALPQWVTGLTLIARRRSAALTAGRQLASATVFTGAQRDMVVALAELIIPRTDTAGATDAGVATFIETVLADAPATQRDEFLDGLAWIDTRSRERFGVDFTGARPEQQAALLTGVATPENEAAGDTAGVAFFQAMKQLTVTGYYTSEIGRREELGDSGTLFFADDPGCQHPEHKS